MLIVAWQMNGRKLMQLCIGSSGACNKRLSTHTHLWSSCWHAALLYSTTSWTASWVAELMLLLGFCTCRSFPRNTTHSQRKLGRLSFIHGVQIGVQRFYVGVLSDGRNFISAISKLVQLSDESFAGHVACHSFVAFFNRCSLDMDCMILPIFPWPILCVLY